jgi:hypothetical protein
LGAGLAQAGRVFTAQWRQPSQPHDRGLGRERRERRKEGHRPRVALYHSMAAVWLYHSMAAVWLYHSIAAAAVWLAGWLPPSFSKPGVRVGVGVGVRGKKRHLPPDELAPLLRSPQERMSAMSQLQPSDSSAAGPGVDQIR